MSEATLVIVESAAKAKTLSKFLGKNYRVKASVGHVRDLPKSKLGIDVENGYDPQYITIRGKGDLLKDLRSESRKAKRVLLATDPDREGEAIAWHLQYLMKIPEDSRCRVEFHEITKEAVTKAIKQSRTVDRDRVDAQQARRVLDRLVGYNLSPLLWAKVKKGLSAGRVQSVTVKIICDREREINAFIPQEYWTIEAELADGSRAAFKARLVSYRKEKFEAHSEAEKDRVLAELEKAVFTVIRLEKKEKRRKPSPPFITSTLQQEGARKLNFFAKRTMKVAQELYEGLEIGGEGTQGLISYIRTDSTRVSQIAQAETLDFIERHYGRDFVPTTPNEYKSRKSAQDAHEAIRPTSVWRTPESIKDYLSRDQYRLYKLIWDRFVASQMAAAVYEQMTMDISAGDYEFRASSSQVRFPGYKKAYDDGDEEQDRNPLPFLEAGTRLKVKSLDGEQHFTQPPPRFTEASLVKFLEEKNIGRPSTYAPTIDTILKRNYVERRNRQFVPTELGFIVVDMLKDNFSKILDIDFTAWMEDELDLVEEGKMAWKKVVGEFYQPFAVEVEKASAGLEKIEIKDEEAGRPCPQCDRPLLIKHGRFGKFIACSGFPECRYTESINMEINVPCPRCGQPVVQLKSRKGRIYYGCKSYPACEFRSWNRPTGQKCPECGDALVEKTSRGQITVSCQNAACKYRETEGSRG